MTRILLPLLIACLLISCNKNTDNSDDVFTISPQKAAIIESNNNFAFDIFREIIHNDPSNENVFISPLSMYYALSMAGIGAANDTKQEFIRLLGWEDKSDDEILNSMKELYSDLQPKNPSVNLQIANSMWSYHGAPIKENYKNQMLNYFDAEVREIDFMKPEAVDIINSWIEDETNNKIEDMLDIIPSNIFMYLINAVYFKADWKYEFKENDTDTGVFTKTDGSTSDVDYMTQTTNLKYFENDKFASVKLPYADSTFCMMVMVPKGLLSANDMIADLTPENWQNWNTDFHSEEVQLTIPKFSFSYGTRLINDELITLGLEEAFELSADFTPITDISICISRVLHKAFIEVNEQGSEAAAATIVEFRKFSTGSDDGYRLTANCPFVFAICHERSQSIMFIGKVENIE